jgi:pimeloyl-ACP methyl ester carboxylesterase
MNIPDVEIVKNYRPIESLVPEHWQRSDYAASDGAILAFHDTGGNRPAVILLHGFQAAGLMWLRTAQALESDYRVLMPDFRAHGFSHASLANFALARLAEDVANMIQALELARPSLVGHSLGAEIAGRVAAQHPSLVRSVVLVDPPMRAFYTPRNTDSEPPPWMQQWLANMRAIKTQPHAERLQTVLSLLPPGAPIWPEADLVAYAQACAQLNLGVLQYASSMPYSVATPEVAGQIRARLLLLTGNPERGSGATPEGIASLMGGNQRRHIAFADSGHFIPVDQFERFVEAVRQFLGQS